MNAREEKNRAVMAGVLADAEKIPAHSATVIALPGGQPAEWPEPTPLPDPLPAVAPFESDLLPGAFRGWIMDIAERMQCPPDFPAVGAIVSLSGLIGARAVAAPKERDDWRVVPNLWGLVIGRPGVMKSPALSESKKPLDRLELSEREKFDLAHAEWETECKLAGIESKENEKKAAKAIKDKARARSLLQAVEPPPEPVMRRLIANDVTQEKLADLLTANPWGLLVYRDELHGLIASMDREGQEGARGFYLTAYDGNQGYAVDRIVRGESYVQRVCFALLGCMQPGKAQSYVREAVRGGKGDDGLLQRFGLTVWPDISGDWRKVDRWPDTDAKDRAWRVFERLSALEPASETTPREWRFTPQAQGIYWDWAEPFEREVRGAELHPALVSHLAKYRKLIPALALIFALVDTPDAGAIGVQELTRALAWGDYLRTHAERLYAAATIPETAGAESLLARIKAGRLADADGVLPESFTPRQIAVKHWAGLATPDEVRKACELLAEYGWLEREDIPTGAAGGRPSERYRLHPVLITGGAS